MPADAPSVRVATTCAALVPQADLDSAAGVPVAASAPTRVHAPTAYADDRAGSLSCVWKADTAAEYPDTTIITITVVPGVTKSAFDARRNGIDVGGMDEQAPYGDDSYTMCYFLGSGTACSFAELANGYGVEGSVFRPGTAQDASLKASDATLFARVNSSVVALGAPAPLWEPPSGSIHGASTCDEIATPQQIIDAIPGTQDPREAKGEGGEYAISTLGSAQLVDSYYCISTGTPDSSGLRLGVLPGGASYVSAAKAADPDGEAAQAVSGVGESAYYFPSEGILDIIAGHGWVEVGLKGAPVDQLIALGAVALKNLGYTG
jgi:hypothetical protein